MRYQWLMVAAGILCQSVWAVPVAQVEAVQKDAWLVRGEGTFRLEPGAELDNGDELRTGAGARLVVRLADESTVKLGEYAQFRVTGLQVPAEEEQGLLSGALEVLKGAFRFTSHKVGKRDLKIQVNAITIGIRGTDLWGRAAGDKDLTCLLEGRIEVAAGEVRHVLDTPRQGFVVPKDGAPLPLQMIPQATVAEWARTTELQE